MSDTETNQSQNDGVIDNPASAGTPQTETPNNQETTRIPPTPPTPHPERRSDAILQELNALPEKIVHAFREATQPPEPPKQPAPPKETKAPPPAKQEESRPLSARERFNKWWMG